MAVRRFELPALAMQLRFEGVHCLSSPDECLRNAKADATYVVQKHIPDPLLYTNGEKCHIKPLGRSQVSEFGLKMGFLDVLSVIVRSLD